LPLLKPGEELDELGVEKIRIRRFDLVEFAFDISKDHADHQKPAQNYFGAC